MSKFSIYCSELRASKGKSCFHCSNWELCYWSATGNEAAQRGKWDEMDGKTPQGQRYIRLKIKKKKNDRQVSSRGIVTKSFPSFILFPNKLGRE